VEWANVIAISVVALMPSRWLVFFAGAAALHRRRISSGIKG
jgi:hypothetical protein